MFGWFKAAMAFGFPFEPLLQIGVRRDMCGQHLDRDRAVQTTVAGFVDLAHPAGAEGRFDLVRAKGGARLQRHSSRHITAIRVSE